MLEVLAGMALEIGAELLVHAVLLVSTYGANVVFRTWAPTVVATSMAFLASVTLLGLALHR